MLTHVQKARTVAHFFLFALLVSHAVRGDDVRTATADTADLVRAIYDGSKALETVAFLDQYIRWPGNRGFDASIDHVAGRLTAAGYILEDVAPVSARLTYRVEEYAMERPAWEPLAAAITIVGQSQPLLEFTTNRNMLAINSYATADGGVTAELVDAGGGTVVELDAADVAGKIVFVEARTPGELGIVHGLISSLMEDAVIARGAVGVLLYEMPGYLKPQSNRHSIQFRGIGDDVGPHHSWAIALSYAAREKLRAALAAGNVQVHVMTDVKWTDDAVERTVVADIHGSEYPDKRFVFSSHVQEPGANDNASGVGTQLEMARTAAALVSKRQIDPKRTITFLWGDEITSTHRYITQDSDRATGIRWGMSLDMAGNDTQKTGGTFLIEKMPDPSAIWTRGEDKHSEWWGRDDPLAHGDMTPHYFNDLVLGRALEQAASNGWVVETNPFEGGSDHVPFLDAGIPGLLLWHFTDQFYHTDRDRLEMVSPDEMKNVGVTALVTALTMATADGVTARKLIDEVRDVAVNRLAAETVLSAAAIKEGKSVAEQRVILETWAGWYVDALATMNDIEVGSSSAETAASIAAAQAVVRRTLAESAPAIER